MVDASRFKIEKLASGGDGIAWREGKVVFVPQSIPGELVEAEIVERHAGYERARLVRVLEASPDRVEAPCAHFGVCGACSLQHMEHAAQLVHKSQAVRESFIRLAGMDPGLLPVRSGAAYGYRNRVQLHCGNSGGLGFMQAESAETVRVKQCPVAVQALEGWLKEQNRTPKPARDLVAAFGLQQRFIVFAQDNRLYIEGRDSKARARVAGYDYSFSVGHFFQANMEMASILVEDVVEGLSGTCAADLYCGAGLFGARLAAQFDKVLCVESDAISLEAARSNIPKGKGLFYPMPVEGWCRTAAGAASCGGAHSGAQGGAQGGAHGGAQGAIDWVVADPPRQGLSPQLRAWLASASIQGLCYVSCDPVTMARDIRELLQHGFRVESLSLYDFYPQTGHFEALARLKKA